MGDGREKGSPSYTVPLGPDGKANSVADPIFVTQSDPVTGNTPSVLSVGPGLNGTVVLDTESRKLLEKILVQQTITNRLLAALVSSAGPTTETADAPDDSGI